MKLASMVSAVLLELMVTSVSAGDHAHRGGYHNGGIHSSHARPSGVVIRSAPVHNIGRLYGHHHHVAPSPRGHWQRRHDGSLLWVVPAIVGGAIVYDALTSTPDTVVVDQQPSTVIVQQPSTVTQVENCSPWTETMNPDGTVTKTRTCTQ